MHIPYAPTYHPPQQKNAFKFKHQVDRDVTSFPKMPFRATDSFRRWVLALALPAASRVARPNYRPSTRAPTSKAHGRNVAKPVLGEPALRSKKARLKKTTTWPLGLIRLILGVRKATKGGLRLS